MAAKNIKSEGGGTEEFVPDEKSKPAASAKKGSGWTKPKPVAASAKKGSGWKKPKLPSVKSHHAPEENNR